MAYWFPMTEEEVKCRVDEGTDAAGEADALAEEHG
jgi:hypothetical protein